MTSPTLPLLEAKQITKQFAGHGLSKVSVRALEDVTLAIHAGRTTALVGESGSGKSTLAQILALGLSPTAGQVRLRGEPVQRLRGRHRRRYFSDVQMILQDPFSSLNALHTVRYILSRPIRIFRGIRDRREVDQHVRNLLERVNISPADDFIDAFPYQLSGGQRQRVAVARALAADPVVLLGDEPVSMLDVSVRLGVLNLLAELRDQENMGLLYITHDIASARYFADEIYVIYAGQLVEYGPSERVTSDPQHPYTQLLLDASPDPDRAHDGRSVSDAPGEPPDLSNPPDGCPFQPRCPHAFAPCPDQFPQRATLSDGGWVHCWLHDADTLGKQGGGKDTTGLSLSQR